MARHFSDSLGQPNRVAEYGDDPRPITRLYAALPEACARLDVFQWEWVRDHDVDRETGARIGAEWVEVRGLPVSTPIGINRAGLAEAAEQVARWVQTELHGYGSEPLEHVDATAFWLLRLKYQNPLFELGGDKLWKDVETRVAPRGQPLSICIGSFERIRVPVKRHGKSTVLVMHGFAGCRRTFPQKPHGRGRPVAQWCPACRPAKTNARKKAISAFIDDAASL